MSTLDDMLAQYGTVVHHSLELVAGKRSPTNVALRLSTGEEVLIALMDLEDHLSVDIDAFDADGERSLRTFTMTRGHATEHVLNAKTVVLVLREDSPWRQRDGEAA